MGADSWNGSYKSIGVTVIPPFGKISIFPSTLYSEQEVTVSKNTESDIFDCDFTYI